MEGAPGAQGAAHPRLARHRPSIRGEYENKPSAQLLARLPGRGLPHVRRLRLGDGDRRRPVGRACSPRAGCSRSPPTPTPTASSSTPGGTATGRPGRTSTTPAGCPTRSNTDTPQPGSDFWPGQFSRTHVGVTRYGYRAVMAGLRAGRVWVDHGQLLDGLDVRREARARPRPGRHPRRPAARPQGREAHPERHRRRPPPAPTPGESCPSWPTSTSSGARCAARSPTGTSWRAPDTKVVHTKDVERPQGHVHPAHPAHGRATSPSTSGCAAATATGNGAGYLGAAVDPHGPIPHDAGQRRPVGGHLVLLQPGVRGRGGPLSGCRRGRWAAGACPSAPRVPEPDSSGKVGVRPEPGRQVPWPRDHC